jgi:competence protein ComGC
MEFLSDLWQFLRERKKFWLAPIIIVLLLIGVILVIGGGSAVAPFIYTLF